MLILTRRVGETLMIGDSVSVTVLGVKGNQVRIGSMHRKTWQYIAKKSFSASSASMSRVGNLRHRRNPAEKLCWDEGR